MEINKDAFSSGQVSSKIWLCEQLEKLGWTSNLTHIYGGWYGITAFLLLSRGKFSVDNIRSLDIDPTCETIADMINENFVWQDWKFKAFTQDCNNFEGPFGDLVINTSTEHFTSNDWYNKLPKGTRVVLQGNNMNHDDHTSIINSLSEFVSQYDLSNTEYTGELDFVYPDWGFTRYMLIGTK
jgi:hypothetical protein